MYSLGYKTYWKTPEEVQKIYDADAESKVLILEVASEMHLVANLDDEMAQHYPVEQILKKEVPIPEMIYKRFGSHKDVKHFAPHFIIARLMRDNCDIYTSSGIRIVYDSNVYAFAGLKNLPAFEYFLYCYDRKDKHFKVIPKETVEKIETFLKEKGRPIYDEI